MIEQVLSKYQDRDFKRKKQVEPQAGPIVQWVGGKRQLIDRYMEYLPKKITNYHEPFMGGASVYFALKEKGMIEGDSYLSDMNGELVTTCNLIVNSHEDISRLVNLINQKHCKELYYEIRNLDRKSLGNKRYEKTADIENILTPIELAARFLYLNKTCFNAIYRVNKDNLFNVPIGTSLKKDFSDNGLLAAAGEVFSSATIKNIDYQEALKSVKSGDFVYLDPPYEPTNDNENGNQEVMVGGKNFTSYTTDGFTSQNQVELKEHCDNLNSQGIQFALSNSNAALIMELYKDYNIVEFTVNRTLNSKKEKRSNSAKEVLVTNF